MSKTIAYIRTTNIYDDSRATKEITTLADNGYDVVVLGWNRNGKALEKCRAIFTSGSISFRFFNVLLPQGIGLKNLDKLVSWNKWISNELKSISQLSAVHACNLDGAYAAYRFCLKKNVPLVYDIYDYYIDSHHIPNMLCSFVERLEIQIINFAACTIICTEERREQIQKSHPNKVVVIHNSPDVNFEESDKAEYDYVYCGSLCDRRLIKEILSEYAVNSDLRIAFAGNDIYQENANNVSQQYSNFEYYGTIPYTEVIELEKKSKVLSAIYEPTIRNHRLCAPNKFYEALALGKPLIVCEGTGIDKVVKDNCLGMVISYDAKDFYSALRRLINNPDEMREMGNRGRKLYKEKYSWSIMKERLISAYSSIGL